MRGTIELMVLSVRMRSSLYILASSSISSISCLLLSLSYFAALYLARRSSFFFLVPVASVISYSPSPVAFILS